MTTFVLLTGLGLAVCLSGCDAAAPGARAYADGRFEEAHAAYVAVTEADHAAAELLYDRALAGLRAGELDDAAASLQRAQASADDELRPLCSFLTGNVAFARAELGAAQARAPEAEPFAWDLAIRHADSARTAFRDAAASRRDWPAARRNAERAARLADALRREKTAADARTAGTSSPEVLLHPGADGEDTGAQDTPPPSQDGGEDGAAADGKGDELTPEQLTALLDLLARKEREKLELRQSGRAAQQTGVERDW